jgi:hypothetical protein
MVATTTATAITRRVKTTGPFARRRKAIMPSDDPEIKRITARIIRMVLDNPSPADPELAATLRAHADPKGFLIWWLDHFAQRSRQGRDDDGGDHEGGEEESGV